jgi:murein DD-endopeptidase MepM/ murein hydrolase activator NlpD
MSKRVYPVMVLFLALLLPWSRVGAEPPPGDVVGQESEWVVYTDEVYGFSVSYPQDWQIMPASNELGSLVTLRSEGPIPLKIEIGVAMTDKPQEAPLEEWISHPLEEGTWISITTSERILNADEVLMQYGGNPNGTILRAYIAYGSKVYMADLVEPTPESEDVFRTILSTWELVKPFERQQTQVDRLFPVVETSATRDSRTSLQSVEDTYILPFSGHRYITQGPYVEGCDRDSHNEEPNLEAIDFKMELGTPIYAAESGTIVFMNWDTTGYGYLIKIEHDDERISYYAHLNSFVSGLAVNSRVRKGQWIARAGTTGSSTGYHLHFMIKASPGSDYDWEKITQLIGIHWYPSKIDYCAPGPYDGYAYGPPALFSDINYQGDSQLFYQSSVDLTCSPGDPNCIVFGNDMAKSIRVNNGGNIEENDWHIVIFQDINYSGVWQEIDQDKPDLSGEPIGASTISSVLVDNVECPQSTIVNENGVNYEYFIFYKDPHFMCGNEGAYKGYIRLPVLKPAPYPDFVYELPNTFGASSVRIPQGRCIMTYDKNGATLARRCCSDISFVGDQNDDGLYLNDNVDTFKWIGFPTDGYCSPDVLYANATSKCLPNEAPHIPSLIQPSNGYVALNHVAPTLCWGNNGDPDGDEVEFNVNVYNDTINITSGWIPNTCWRPSQLDYQYGSYQWRVQARDAGNATKGWGATWGFSIAPPNRPPSIAFNTANGNAFPSGVIISRDANWTFSGTANDPEGALNRVEFRCSGDNCGTHYAQSGLGDWTYERHGIAGQNDVYFMAIDDAGNYNYSRHLDLRIDLAAPTTQASLNNETTAAHWPTWFRVPVAVRLAASDGSTGRARAGVQEIRYRVDAGAWQIHGGGVVNFTIDTDGAHTVEYYAVDKVSNTESTRTVSFQIDQTPPSLPAGVVETHGVAHNVWQKAQNAPTFTWDASSDVTSGVWGYQFHFGKDPNGIGYQTFRASEPRQWMPQPDGVHTGVYYLRGRARDNAGNWSAWTNLFTFRYDETPPENPEDIVHTAGITSTVWQRVTNTPDFAWTTPHDEGSGVQGYYVYWGPEPEGTTSSFITSHSFQDNTPLCAADAVCTGYLRLRSVDNVDNVANEWSTGFVMRYDNVPPVVDFTFNSGITSTDQTRVTLNIAAIDEGSGVQALRLSPNGQTWLPWEVYRTTHEWFVPGISRQYWPVYVQVRDGVGLESAVISHTIYLDVNRTQSRSANFRLFDHTLSAGAGEYTSTIYSGRGTIGQIIDGAVVTSTNYQVEWGYEAGNQSLPLIIPGHDDFAYVNGIFASGTGATTLTSHHFTMLGTFNEIGLTNTTTLTSTTFTHQPGFLAAAPSVRPSAQPTQTVGPPPPPEPPLACETPYVLINKDALFTEQLTVTLDLCAPHGTQMLVSNNVTFTGAIWEPYAITKTWVLSDTGPQTTARFVYVLFQDDKNTIHETYFDDILYDTSPPSMTILLEADIPVDGAQTNQRALATRANTGVEYVETSAGGCSRWSPMLTANTEGAVPIYVGGTDANSGIAEMQFSDNITFIDTTWEPYAPIKLYAPPGEDGLKTVYARARDGAGNISSIITGTFFYDTHVPAGDIVFDTFAVQPNAITTTLHTGAWDNSSGVSDMRVSTSPVFADAAWEPYTHTVVVPLSLTAQSTLTMYAQYRDSSGNLSATYNDTLYTDGEPPVVYVDVSDTELSTDTGSIILPVRTVTIYAYDDHSGIANRYISNDPLMQEGVVTLPYASTITWEFNESRIAWVQAEDSLGNLSAPHPVYASESNIDNQVYLPLVMKQ